MSSKISFEGIGEVVATFACGEGVIAGQVVKVTEDCMVGPCSDGEKFCGVALSAEDGYAAVQLGGLVKVAATGEDIQAGWVKLSADSAGGVKKDDSAGVEYLVVRVETDGAVVRL